MAENIPKVLLGFEDEPILEKHHSFVNYTTNKIGGKPDWPINFDIKTPKCPLCELPRPLVLQIYAPLDNSSYHRTLYIFACINPNCWNQNESWICLRNQASDQKCDTKNVPKPTDACGLTDWCRDADEWDDDNGNVDEENGNVIDSNRLERSDDEDESCSFEEVVRAGMGNLTVDDRNANMDVQGGGAVGRQNSPIATAEIEGDEGEVVTIDTPVAPQLDIAALLQQVTPLPQDLCQKAQNDANDSFVLQFTPLFINVAEETYGDNISDHHIRDLLQEYQQNNDDGDFQNVSHALAPHNEQTSSEKYEKSVPAHGDRMFHNFLTKIQNNPGQVLRYHRAGTPMFLYPAQDVPRKCKYCQGDATFELQILPTLIPKLTLSGVEENDGSRIEFGTVLVFTCARSCWSRDGNFKEEAVVVQFEKY